MADRKPTITQSVTSYLATHGITLLLTFATVVSAWAVIGERVKVNSVDVFANTQYIASVEEDVEDVDEVVDNALLDIVKALSAIENELKNINLRLDKLE